MKTSCPILKRLWPLAVIAVVIIATAYVLLVTSIKKYLTQEIGIILGGRFSVAAISYRAPLSLSAREVSLRENDSDAPIVSAPRGIVTFRPVLSPRLGLKASRLELEGAQVNVIRDETGNWNFMTHVRAVEESSKPGGKPRIFFSPCLRLRDSRFIFSDRALNIDKTLDKTSLKIDLSSLPKAELLLSGRVSDTGHPLEISGSLSEKGDILLASTRLGDCDLTPFIPYLANFLGPLRLDQAKAKTILASLELAQNDNFSLLVESSLYDVRGALKSNHSLEGSARTRIELQQHWAGGEELHYRVEIVPDGLNMDGIGLPKKIELDRGLFIVSPRGFQGEDLAGKCGERPFTAQGDWIDWRENGLKTRLQILGWSFDLNLSPSMNRSSYFQIAGSALNSKLTAEGHLFDSDDFKCRIEGEIAMKDLSGFLPPIPGEDKSRLKILSELDGPLGKPEQWRGWANLEISEGKIWELPLFQGLWQILVLFQPNLKKMSFYHIQSDFDIREGRAITKNLKMNSVNVGLLAQGELTFSGKLDYEIWLKFFPESRSILTIVSDGASELIGTVFHVKLGGNLKKPSWRPALSLIEHYPEKLGRFFLRLLPI